MNKTNIEYLDYTWNVTHGCSLISEGCKNCWARIMSKRLAGMRMRGYSKEDPFKVICCPEKLNEPLSIKKPSRIGVSFMGDLFHEDMPYLFQYEVFTKIAESQHHTFLILTKRPLIMQDFIRRISYITPKELPHLNKPSCSYNPNDYRDTKIIPNLWLGVSVENQKTADERIPILLKIPAKLRFISVEPCLESVDLSKWLSHTIIRKTITYEGEYNVEHTMSLLDWIIVGCESGPSRRPFKEPWVRFLKDQCISRGIRGEGIGTPFFYKQGIVNNKLVKMPELDGQVWNQYPIM